MVLKSFTFLTIYWFTQAAFAAQVPGVVSLDGTWSLSVRYRGASGSWSKPEEKREVQVPGSFFPDLPEKGHAVELLFEKPLPDLRAEVLRGATGGRIIAEFDSVDYEAQVELVGLSGAVRALGSHKGYLGRFGVAVPSWQAGDKLRVRVSDSDRGAKDFDEIIVKPATSIQGIDDLANNRTGIVESCRLRVTGPYYLRNAFAIVLSTGFMRIAADVLPLQKSGGVIKVRYALYSAGRRDPGVSGTFLEKPSDAVQALTLWKDIPLPENSGLAKPQNRQGMFVRISIESDGGVSDVREVPLSGRTLTAARNRILLDGEPIFLKGTVAFEASRLLPLDTVPLLERYKADGELVRSRISVYIREFLKAHGNLVRFAHHVPIRLFHERLADTGILVYQDFPLAFNIDHELLPNEEILRQFDEFIWRVSAEPAVAIIALHNEAEIKDPSPQERKMIQALMRLMARRAAELAPHLLQAGVSGGGGTAVFPPDPAYSLPEIPVSDVHGYPGSGWQPLVGYRELFDYLLHFDRSDGKPVIWSELGEGGIKAFEGLLSVDDSLRKYSDIKTFSVAGRKLTTREFCALVKCKVYDKLPKEQWVQCVKENAVARNDKLLIERAKDFYFAGRDKVLVPPNRDIHRWALRLGADWLCTQIYEARLAYFAGKPMSGVTPWDAARIIGFPVSPALYGLGANVYLEEHRETVARAYAPIAVYARPPEAGKDITVYLLNDGAGAKGRLSVLYKGREIYAQDVTLTARHAMAESIAAGAFPSHLAGKTVALTLSISGKEFARYSIGLPGAPLRR